MNIALVHDWILTRGGSERVLEKIHQLFPGPIHTLFTKEEALKGSYLEKCTFKTSSLQKCFRLDKLYRWLLPFFPIFIEKFNLDSYKVILSSSHAFAKAIISHDKQCHICYCHTPMRYAWWPNLYSSELKKNTFLKQLILHYLRNWDVNTHQRVDYFIANSETVARRIKRVYGRDSKVIYPPVDTKRFKVESDKDSFFLTVSRLVPYKRVDLIVEAFKELDLKLLVIGEGAELKHLKSKATKNIEFLTGLSDPQLTPFFEKARAFIFAAEEDFGIAPVEAMASGTPVIAYKKGGAEETIEDKITGVFFSQQTPYAIREAVHHFMKIEDSFDPHKIRKRAELFSEERFSSEFSHYVNQCIQEYL